MKRSDKAKMIKLDEEVTKNIPYWGEQLNRKHCRLLLCIFLVRLKEFRKTTYKKAAKGREIGNYYVLVEYKEDKIGEECINIRLAHNNKSLIGISFNIYPTTKIRRVAVTHYEVHEYIDYYDVNENITL